MSKFVSNLVRDKKLPLPDAQYNILFGRALKKSTLAVQSSIQLRDFPFLKSS